MVRENYGKILTTESAMNLRFVDEHEKVSVADFFIPAHGGTQRSFDFLCALRDLCGFLG